jgi:NAD(P)-dependent dehydrogenase (short-subunit alcohol dehydrogenase family)
MAGRSIVITGATRGLGRVLFDTWRAEGHRVAGCGRGGGADGLDAVDVTDEAAVAAWARAVIDRQGPPDLLLNNAALMNDPAPLWTVPAEAFDRLLAVNVGGLARVIRHFVPAMIAAGRGVIVNLSSGWGRSTSPGVAPYCASKYAVEGLSSGLADDLPPGLASVAVSPGVIDTDMLRQCWGPEASSFPPPAAWVRRAAPFFLSLTAADNGRSTSVPGGEEN